MKNIWIYGTGLTARRLGKRFIEKGYHIIGFLQGGGNHPCFIENSGNVYDIYDERLGNKEVSVYICIENAYAPIRKIKENLRKAGWNNIISYAEMIDLFPDMVSGFLYLERKDAFQQRIPAIRKAENIFQSKLADQKSMDHLMALLKFRESKDYNVLLETDKKIYMPSEITEWWEREDCFVDCGAFEGDTLLSVAQSFSQMKHYIGLEPDSRNFERLKEMTLNVKNIEQINIFPYGVWNENKKMSFKGNAGESSCISPDGEDSIECIPLDKLLKDIPISHIKMDVEGAEGKALSGAEYIIKKNRPNLAVSIYHKPEDIYEILFQIESFDLDYKYYIRVYEDTGFDTVLYAV